MERDECHSLVESNGRGWSADRSMMKRARGLQGEGAGAGGGGAPPGPHHRPCRQPPPFPINNLNNINCPRAIRASVAWPLKRGECLAVGVVNCPDTEWISRIQSGRDRIRARYTETLDECAAGTKAKGP
ncbi:unnamed protein product, partial [Iphiclides podalirius]